VERLLAWRGPDPARVDAASVTLGDGALRARGTSVTADYTVEWSLSTGTAFVTTRLSVRVRSDEFARSLDLVRAEDTGAWSAVRGDHARPPSLLELTGLDTAVDCDLAYCPFTNTMPVLRHDLVARARHGDTAPVDFVMAWVAVPGLTVQSSAQRYTPVSPAADGGALITYESGTFEATIEFDADGLVREYPYLGSRIDG
jgi:hypothetical protein